MCASIARYLSAAGGIPAAEAEIVCDILFDEGIYSVSDLTNLVSLDTTAVLSLQGIQRGAAMTVTKFVLADIEADAKGKERFIRKRQPTIRQVRSLWCTFHRY